jgi:hypothetical protein
MKQNKNKIFMNVNQALRRLKIMLSRQYSFAEATLVDGTAVYTEGELEVGAILFVRAGEGVSEDPFAPAGMHETTEGVIVTVGENGEITEIANKEEEAAEEEVEVKVEEAMEEVEVEVPVAPEALPVTEDLLNGIAELIAPFTEEIAALNEEVIALKKRFETMAAEPAASKVKNTFANVLADKNTATANRIEALAKMRKSK